MSHLFSRACKRGDDTGNKKIIMVKDAVSDFLIRLKNAQAVKKESVTAPYSKLVWELAKILEREGYVANVEKRGKRVRRGVEMALVYEEDGRGRIGGAKRISRLSQRVYKKASAMYPVRHGFGTQIITTSRGLMTVREARKARIGGEVLFEIW